MPLLELREPSQAEAESLRDFRAEMLAEAPLINGGAGLEQFEHIDEWLRRIRLDADERTVHPGWVPATVWLGVRCADGRVVGILSFRHRLNPFLRQHGGHIGYSVRPTERRKGYAAEMLRLALARGRERGLDRVLITCDRANIASARTIRAAGGRLENEIPDGGRVTQRYWVCLTGRTGPLQ